MPQAPSIRRPEPDPAPNLWGLRQRARLRRRLALRRLAAAATSIMAATLVYTTAPPQAPSQTPVPPGPNSDAVSAELPPPADDPNAPQQAGPLGLRADEVAVALEQPLAPLPLATGDIVELVGVVANEERGASATRIGHARVLILDDRSITVALSPAAAWSLIEFRAVGTIEAVLTAKPSTPQSDLQSGLQSSLRTG